MALVTAFGLEWPLLSCKQHAVGSGSGAQLGAPIPPGWKAIGSEHGLEFVLGFTLCTAVAVGTLRPFRQHQARPPKVHGACRGIDGAGPGMCAVSFN